MVLISNEEIEKYISSKNINNTECVFIDNLKKCNENILDFYKKIFVRNLSLNIINSNSNSSVLLECLQDNGISPDQFISKYNLKSKRFFSNYLQWMSAEDTTLFYNAVQKELNKPNPRYFELLGRKAAAKQPNLHKMLFAFLGGPSLQFMFQYLPTLNRGFNNIVSVQYVTVNKRNGHHNIILLVKTFENFIDDWDIKNFFWFGGNLLAIPFLKGYRNSKCKITVFQYSLLRLLEQDYKYLNLNIEEKNDGIYIDNVKYAAKINIRKERIKCNYSWSSLIKNYVKKIINRKMILLPQYKDILSNKINCKSKSNLTGYYVEKDLIDAKSGEYIIQKGEVFDAPYFRYEIEVPLKKNVTIRTDSNTEIDNYLSKLQEQVIELEHAKEIAEEEAKKAKEAESELSALYKNLEEKIKERTEELQKANEKISLQIHEKTAFFVNLAHETRTPATLMLNYLNKCIKKYPADKDLFVVKNNLEKHIRDMVNFLDAEKIEQGRLSYDERKKIDFVIYLKSKVDLITPTAEIKGINLNTNFPDSLYINSNIQALDRILNNLLDNAMRYTPREGFISINLSSIKEDQILIEISDSGCGIPSEKQAHIFEKYYQVSHAKGNTQGIGMGLYITKSVVENLGGSISLKSDSNGTTFSIVIPKGDVDTVNEDGCSCYESATQLTIPSYDNEIEDVPVDIFKSTVLLVEDNLELICSMRESLKEEYNVLCALNGQEALKKLCSNKPEIIVSDVMMDVMDGYKLLEVVRKNPQTADIPFVFLTAKSGISEEIRGLSSGAIDYIQKPFAVEALKARIKALLDYNLLKKKAFELEKYRSVGMLTAGICHEIMNPLSGIKGPLFVVERDVKEFSSNNETLNQGISYIKQNVNRISDIVNTMRSLFHGEGFSFEEIEFSNFIKPVIDIYKDKNTNSIEIETKIPENFIIKSSKSALTHIFMNLLSNAIESIKFQGKIKIEASDRTIVIQDTGCGISVDNLRKVFNLAFTTKKDFGGTGLGLFIVKELADRLNISINIESEINRGTTVSLFLKNHEEIKI